MKGKFVDPLGILNYSAGIYWRHAHRPNLHLNAMEPLSSWKTKSLAIPPKHKPNITRLHNKLFFIVIPLQKELQSQFHKINPKLSCP